MPYINIQVTAGVTRQQKEKLVKEITDSVVSILNKEADHTHIVIQEVAWEDWGHAGELAVYQRERIGKTPEK